MNKLGLIPLRNFAHLDNNIYRSAQPGSYSDYRWLKEVLNLGTIVNLRSESRHDERFAPDLGIKVINIDVKDHKEPTTKQAEHFIEIIKQHIHSKESLLFHCEHGHGRTSTFCVLARLATKWTLEEALKEEKEKFHYSFRHHIQEDFLNSFYETTHT